MEKAFFRTANLELEFQDIGFELRFWTIHWSRKGESEQRREVAEIVAKLYARFLEPEPVLGKTGLQKWIDDGQDIVVNYCKGYDTLVEEVRAPEWLRTVIAEALHLEREQVVIGRYF